MGELPQGSFLCFLEIVNNGASGAYCQGQVSATEAVKGGGTEMVK